MFLNFCTQIIDLTFPRSEVYSNFYKIVCETDFVLAFQKIEILLQDKIKSIIHINQPTRTFKQNNPYQQSNQ